MPQAARTRSWPLVLITSASLLLGACSATTSAQTPQTATVERGDIEATVSGSGTVAALASVNLALAGGGTIAEVFVKPGDRVQAGQSLLRVDTHDLELQLAQAEANVVSAQAKYDQVKSGASEKDIAQAEAAVRSAQAKYQQTARGTTTPQDIANAEAAVRSAEARLAAAQAGTTTDADIASAEAAVRSAQAKLDDLMNGPAPTDVDAAVQKLTQAKESRAKTESQLANAKEQARIAMEQAADSLRQAQAAFGASQLIYEEAVRTGKDPNIPPPQKGQPDTRSLTDAKLRQYKADFESKQLAMSQAEATLAARSAAYEDAKKQEVAGLQVADSQILDAQGQLDALRAAPVPEQVTQAQAAVDQAQANLDKLHQPPKEADIVQAQAAVDQARANLDKLRRGPAAEDLEVAQAAVDQAEATMTDLTRGPANSDLAVALASVRQNEAARDLQRSKLDQATLVAPFAGVVAAVNASPGQQATSTATSPLVTLVDDSQLHVDVRVAENDVPNLALGQEVRVTFEALPDRTLTGRVAFTAPTATVEQNVVSYLTTVVLDPGEAPIKPGMTANVSIITARKEGVLLVPNRAVRAAGGQRVVEVRYKGASFTAPVQIGMTSDTVSEVVSGLKEGDTVVISVQPTNRVQPVVGGPATRR